MTETFRTWDAAGHLRTREDVRLYVKACSEEALSADDNPTFPTVVRITRALDMQVRIAVPSAEARL